MTATSLDGNSSAAVRRSYRTDIQNGLGIWLISNFIVIGGGLFGWLFVAPGNREVGSASAALANWDGNWYASIVEDGYSYEPDKTTKVAFFPAYPLAARAFAAATGCSSKLSLLLVAQIFLLAGFIAFHAYLRLRFPTAPPAFALTGLLLFAVFPPTFFFRMAYSEAMFCCLTACILLAVQTRTPLLVLAVLVGLATATRPVGAGLVLVVFRETWRRSSCWKSFVGRCLILLPISLWGLIAYSVYLDVNFGDPLAFAKAQEAWNSHGEAPWNEKVYALLTFKPIWGSFTPEHGHYFPTSIAPDFFTIGASGMNALVYIWGLVAIAIGWWRRWLNGTESIIAIALLGIPYVTRGFESQFLSFARFTAVVLPIYIPMAFLYLRLPRLGQLAYLFFCVWSIILLTALFAAGFHIV